MILKKPTYILIVLSLVSALFLAVPQPALAADDCPEGYTLIVKYEWDDVLGWVPEIPPGRDVITFGPDSEGRGPDNLYGSWESTEPIAAIVIKDGNIVPNQVYPWFPNEPGRFSGEYSYEPFFGDDPVIPGMHAISHITFCGHELPVTLASFTGQVNRGRVAIDWGTATEINNAGFMLYRSSTADGPKVQVTVNLIAAKGAGVTGASYRVTDAPGYGTFYYWLKDVDYSGKGSLHGPVTVTVSPAIRPPVYRPSLPGQ